MRFNLIVISAGIVFDNASGASKARDPIFTAKCQPELLELKKLQQKNADREIYKQKYYKEISDEKGFVDARDRLFEIPALSAELTEEEFVEKEALEEMIFDWYQRGISIPPKALDAINFLIIHFDVMPQAPGYDCRKQLEKVKELTSTAAKHLANPPDPSVMRSVQGLPSVARLQRPGPFRHTPMDCNGPRLNPALHHPDMSAWKSVLEGIRDTEDCLEETRSVRAEFKKAYYKQLVYEEEIDCAMTRFRELAKNAPSRTEMWERGILKEMIIESSPRRSLIVHSESARENFHSLQEALRDMPLQTCMDTLSEVQTHAMDAAIHANYKPLKSFTHDFTENDFTNFDAAVYYFETLQAKKDRGKKLKSVEEVRLGAKKMMTDEFGELCVAVFYTG